MSSGWNARRTHEPTCKSEVLHDDVGIDVAFLPMAQRRHLPGVIVDEPPGLGFVRARDEVVLESLLGEYHPHEVCEGAVAHGTTVHTGLDVQSHPTRWRR